MPFTDPALNSLNASVTLPSGMNGKARMFSVNESRRYKDSEGLADGGFATGKLTGQRLTGSISGFLNGGNPGLGTSLENVAITFQADNGRLITGNFDITDITWNAAVGELQTFSGTYVSNGPYTIGL